MSLAASGGYLSGLNFQLLGRPEYVSKGHVEVEDTLFVAVLWSEG